MVPDTLVVTLDEALSPAERDMAKSPVGAAQVHVFRLTHNVPGDSWSSPEEQQ